MNKNKSARVFTIGFIIFALLFAFCAALLLFLGIFLEKKTGEAKSVIDSEYLPRIPRCVVIDAGHGGEDGGTVSADGVLEKDLNLELSKILYDLFSANGTDAQMTRTEDKMLYDNYPDEYQKGRKKMLDLRARVEAAEKTEGAILLSIHMNSYPDASCRGAQVYFSPNNDESRNIAGKIQTYIAANLQKDNGRKIKSADDDIYLLYRTKCPAVLVECGFLSNPEETKLLSDEAYRKKLACAIFASIADYLCAS